MVCYKDTKYCYFCKYWFCNYCNIRWYDPFYTRHSNHLCQECFKYRYILQS